MEYRSRRNRLIEAQGFAVTRCLARVRGRVIDVLSVAMIAGDCGCQCVVAVG
jgi:hypothetical protein